MTEVERCTFCCIAVKDFIKLKYQEGLPFDDFNFENTGIQAIIACYICNQKLNSLYRMKMCCKMRTSTIDCNDCSACCICQKFLSISDRRYLLNQMLQQENILNMCEIYFPDLVSSVIPNNIICEMCKVNLNEYADFINMILLCNADILRVKNISKLAKCNSNFSSKVVGYQGISGLETENIEKEIKVEFEEITIENTNLNEEYCIKQEPYETNDTQDVVISNSPDCEIEAKTEINIDEADVEIEADFNKDTIIQGHSNIDSNLDNNVFVIFKLQQPSQSSSSTETQNTNHQLRRMEENCNKIIFPGSSSLQTINKSIQMVDSSELYFLRKKYIFLKKQFEYYQNLYDRKSKLKRRIYRPVMSPFMRFSWASKAIISMQILGLMTQRKNLKNKKLCEAIISMQTKNKFRPWSYSEKKLAFLIYYKDPSLYRFLKKLRIVLPPVSSLKKWMVTTNLFPGINRLDFRHLKLKVETMDEIEKQCVVSFGMMKVNPHLEYCEKVDVIEGFEDLGPLGRTNNIADRVLVFIAQGLYADWKIPIAYFLVKGFILETNLRELVIIVFTKMIEIGFLPKVLLSQHRDYTKAAMSLLGVTDDFPFFTLKCDKIEQKIFCIFDIPELIGSVWNELFNNNFLLDKNVVSFYDVDSVYTLDRQFGTMRNLPKISLSANKKMQTESALQVFSQPMASAIKYYVATQQLLSQSAPTTASFIETVSKLCDSFHNDRSIENSQLLDNIQKSFEIFKVLMRVDYPKHCRLFRPPVFNALTQSINAVLLLFAEERSCEQEDIVIPTNKLNSSALLTFLTSATDALKRNNQCLNAHRFRLWYKTQYLKSLTKPIKNSILSKNDNVDESKDTVGIKEEIFEDLEITNEVPS